MTTASVERSAAHARPLNRLVTDGGVRTRARRAKTKVGGVPTSLPTSIPSSISTESGVVVFNSVVGIGMFLAQVVAARNLSTVSGSSVSLRSVAIPAIAAVGAIALAATFLPSS